MPVIEASPLPASSAEGSVWATPRLSVTHPPEGMTVLIVDDSPVDRRLAAAMIARHPGFRPVVTSGGREALEFISRDLPAAVITDLQMPDINGLDLVEAIRRDYPGLPVILMTAYGSEDIAIRALNAGAANYVPKKSLASNLLDTLVSVLALAAGDLRRRKLRRCVESTRSSLRIENDPELIAPLIAMLQEDIDGIGILDGNVRTRVGVALQEALTNAMFHGNLEVSSDLRQVDEKYYYAEAKARRGRAPYCDRTIHVAAELDRDSATYRIRDEGPGFDTKILDAPFDPETLTRVGGRGMILIRTFMDEVTHNAAGNEMVMAKKWKAEG